MDPDGTNGAATELDPVPWRGFDNPEWSPASDRLAVAVEAGRGADPFQKDIWVISLDGAPEIDVSNDPADEGSAAWSPDGRASVLGPCLALVSPGLQVVKENSEGQDPPCLPRWLAARPHDGRPMAPDVMAVEPGAGTGVPIGSSRSTSEPASPRNWSTATPSGRGPGRLSTDEPTWGLPSVQAARVSRQVDVTMPRSPKATSPGSSRTRDRRIGVAYGARTRNLRSHNPMLCH